MGFSNSHLWLSVTLFAERAQEPSLLIRKVCLSCITQRSNETNILAQLSISPWTEREDVGMTSFCIIKNKALHSLTKTFLKKIFFYPLKETWASILSFWQLVNFYNVKNLEVRYEVFWVIVYYSIKNDTRSIDINYGLKILILNSKHELYFLLS